MSAHPTAPGGVLVLCGGPDAEREVSLNSGRAVAAALGRAGWTVRLHELPASEPPTCAQLAALIRSSAAAAVFPALHGRWGEGGQAQRALEESGVPFVGSGSTAGRLAMDKAGTKLAAADALRRLAERGQATPLVRLGPTLLLDAHDTDPPLPMPFITKPNCEGSTIGLHIVRDALSWEAARADLLRRGGNVLAEPYIQGAEITLPLLDLDADGTLHTLPMVHITPASGHYDYQAKYQRDDTRYRVIDDMDADAAEQLQRFARELALVLGVRHLSRADFILRGGTPQRPAEAWFLEINTMPGFTDHSLLPMAAAARGMHFDALCDHLVKLALGVAAPAAART